MNPPPLTSTSSSSNHYHTRRLGTSSQFPVAPPKQTDENSLVVTTSTNHSSKHPVHSEKLDIVPRTRKTRVGVSSSTFSQQPCSGSSTNPGVRLSMNKPTGMTCTASSSRSFGRVLQESRSHHHDPHHHHRGKHGFPSSYDKIEDEDSVPCNPSPLKRQRKRREPQVRQEEDGSGGSSSSSVVVTTGRVVGILDPLNRRRKEGRLNKARKEVEQERYHHDHDENARDSYALGCGNDDECDKENELNELISESLQRQGSSSSSRDVPSTSVSGQPDSTSTSPMLNPIIIADATSMITITAAAAPDLNGSFTEKISNLALDGYHTINELDAPNQPPTSQQPVPVPPRYFRRFNSSTIPPTRENEHHPHHQSPEPETLYSKDILNYWHTLEQNRKVDPKYMSKQKEVSFKMRTILVDWLVEVVEEYSVGNATLHRAVHFVDRFLSKVQVTRTNLQLLGTASLFIASKIEEIQPPDTGDLVYITDNTYTKRELLRMELVLLSVLEFNLITPTAYEFTTYFSNILNLPTVSRQCANYLIELTLLHGEKYLAFEPSSIAIASCYVAIRCCGAGIHDDEEHTEQQENDSYQRSNKTNNRSNNNNNTTNPRPYPPGSVPQFLSRIPRLNVTPDFTCLIEKVASHLFLTVLTHSSPRTSDFINQSTRSSSSSSSSTRDTTSECSLTSKYKQFQTERFLAAAASSAACLPIIIPPY